MIIFYSINKEVQKMTAWSRVHSASLIIYLHGKGKQTGLIVAENSTGDDNLTKPGSFKYKYLLKLECTTNCNMKKDKVQQFPLIVY